MRVKRNGKELRLKVDFNQGLDSSLIKNLDIAMELKRSNVDPVRLAYDRKSQRKFLERCIKRLKEVGFKGRHIFVYTFYNHLDTPQDFWERVCDLMEWGVAVYPMRFEPLNSLQKNEYISPGWT